MNKLHQQIKMIDTVTAFMDAQKPAIHAQIPESELTDLMEQDQTEEANREDLEFMEECREDKMAWDVDESQA